VPNSKRLDIAIWNLDIIWDLMLEIWKLFLIWDLNIGIYF